MRKRLLVAVSLLAATAACTTLLGDFTFKAGGKDAGIEASTGDDGGTVGETGVTVVAVAPDVSVYLGQVAVLDGSMSTTTEGTLTYTWTVGSVPSGSNVATQSLTGATSAKPQFTPDVPGVYTLLLAVSAFGVQNTATVTVTALLPQVFYAQGTVTDAGPVAAYTVADFSGANAHPVLCPKVVVTTVTNEIASFAAYGGRAYDFWEAPAGQPSKFAGFLMDFKAGLGYSAHLYSGTTASFCDAGAPIGLNDLGATSFGPGRPYGSDPHFSPDGSRFVVYDDKWEIITYSSDGTPPTNVVTTYPLTFGAAGLDPSGAASLPGYLQEPPRVEWMPGASTELAWAIPQPLAGGGLGWAIMTAKDGVGSTPSTFMTCAGMVPREIAILSDDTVIASYRQTATSPENLVHLKSTSGTCDVELTYTSLGNVSGAIATDFAVSPDGTQIAFLQVDPSSGPAAGPWATESNDAAAQLPGGYVYIVPVNGGTPKQVSATPAIYGPRWIGAGRSLIFTGLRGLTSAGLLETSVVVVQTDGTGQAIVATGDGVSTFVSTSGNAACNSAPGGRGAPLAGALLSLAAIAQLVRRRRRR
jgi:hypothetical protein